MDGNRVYQDLRLVIRASTPLKRIVSLIVGILAGVAGLYLIFLSVAVLLLWGEPGAPTWGTGILAIVVLGVAVALFFESYRLIKFFSKKLK